MLLFKEGLLTLKAPSAIHHHSIQTGHTTNQNNVQIIGREGQNLARNIKESIYIRHITCLLIQKVVLKVFKYFSLDYFTHQSILL